MASIAFFCLSRSLAHASRVARLAVALRERGHSPTLYGAPGWLAEPLLWPEGVAPPIVAHEEPSLEEVLRTARGEPPAEPEHLTFGRAMLADLTAMRVSRPDLVVVDNRRSALVAAEALGIPTLSLTTAALLGPLAALPITARDYGRIFLPVLGEQVREAPDTPITPRPVEVPGPLAWAMIALDGRPRAYVHELSLGTATAILDPPDFAPMAALPPGAFQPGPLLPRLYGPTPPLPDGEDPLIYLSFGSTGDPAGLARAAAALSGLRCLVSTGGLTTATGAQFRLAPVDGLLRAAALTVCHGGTLTVYHALSAGCPVLALPGHLEQAWTAVALEKSGAGRSLPASVPAQEPERFVEVARAMLGDPALRQSAARWASRIDGEATLEALIGAVQRLL